MMLLFGSLVWSGVSEISSRTWNPYKRHEGRACYVEGPACTKDLWEEDVWDKEGYVARRWACSVGRGRMGQRPILKHLVVSIKEGQRKPWKTLGK